MTPSLRFISSHHWAMVPATFDALTSILLRHAAGERLVAKENAGLLSDLGLDTAAVEPRMTVLGSTALVPIRGVIARYADQVNGSCQDQGRSADALLADLATIAADPAIQRAVLVIDSPGGTVAGTAEVAEAVRALSASKPVTAYVDGLAASAAFWIASQADEIVASAPTAEVGSIGVITAFVDSTRADEKDGYRVQVMRSTALKAPGAFGQGMDAQQAASVQRLLSDLHGSFAAAVAAGRGMTAEQVAAIATGELYTAQTGIANGLVDRIASLAAVLAGFDPVAAEALPVAAMRLRSAGTSDPTASTPTPPADAAVPEGTPPTAATETPMLTVPQVAALLAVHIAHAELIGAMAKDPTATEASILKAIDAAQLTTAQAALAAEQTAHNATKASLATAEADLVKEKARMDALTGIARTPDPGEAAATAFDATVAGLMSGNVDPKAVLKGTVKVA